MVFPHAERVVYQRNPLDEVICQFRFPAALQIEAEAPVAFQDLIKLAYPLYTESMGVKLPAGVPEGVVDLLRSEFPGGGRRSHLFESPDKQWALTLSRESLALTCRDYERWEDFQEHLRGPFDALIRCYGPAFFTRLGLRYRNVIRRSLLGLEDVPWSELIQPWVCGVLGPNGAGEAVQQYQAFSLIRLPDELGQTQVKFGLTSGQWQADHGRTVEETVFLIDADLFTERTEYTDVFSRLAALNRQGGLLFRWCIAKRLHDALGPRTLSDH